MATRYPRAFLDDLRDRLPVSTVVGATVAIKRAGREWRGLSPFNKERTPSLFVNDAKQAWFDFSANKHGDIFAFLIETTGCTFAEAVTELARLAGVPLPAADPEDDARAARRATLREIVAWAQTWFVDQRTLAAGADARTALAQRGLDAVAIDQWGLGYAPRDGLKAHLQKLGAGLEDIEEAGLIQIREGATAYSDRFQDRITIPIHDASGRIVGFGARAMRDDQVPKYLNSPETPLFHKGAVLFNAHTIRGRALKGESLLVVEGYFDVVALDAVGRAAVATMGTAVTDVQLRALWTWADEPIVCLDGDDAGQRAAGRVLDMALPLLAPGRSIRFARFPAGIDPDKLIREEGAEALDAILEAAQPAAGALWARELAAAPLDTPEACAGLEARLRGAAGLIADATVRAAYSKHLGAAMRTHLSGRPVAGYRSGGASRFGRVSWADQDATRESSYDWWVKGLVAKRQTVAVIGAMGCGKSFETFNLGGHIATGTDYRGHRTRQGLVIFAAPEGGAGVVDRMRAYRREHGLPLDGVPFEALTHRFNLFATDTDMTGLIAEVQQISADWPQFELALLIVDTWSAATTGMDENSSKDVSLVRSRVVRIERECNCGVLFVHHMNAAGERQRGHSSITADVESVLSIAMLTRMEGRTPIQVIDDNNRPVRRITNFKQREAESGQHWDFVLAAREVRHDADGDPVTSCVSIAPTRATEERPQPTARPVGHGQGFHLNGAETAFFKALLAAIDAAGERTPRELRLPASIARVVAWEDFKAEFGRRVPNEEGTGEKALDRHRWRLKAQLGRARKALLGFGIIGIDQVGGPDGHHVIWPTGKRVWGDGLVWPAASHAANGGAPPPDYATLIAPDDDQEIPL